MTGLPNRVSFRDEIERLLTIAQSRGDMQPAALLFIDLDQFKQVNDSLGHPCGDRLLCDVANRLREMLRPEDFIARFGGDEFVVFQQHLKSDEDAARCWRAGSSIGSANATSSTTTSGNRRQHRHRDDRAGHQGRRAVEERRHGAVSRQGRRPRHLLLLPRRNGADRSKPAGFWSWICAARSRNEEFELYYQPLVNLKTGRISTCEALLRWNHPVRGMVSPIDIIPVAEEMGLIVDLGRWILRKACSEGMRLARRASASR